MESIKILYEENGFAVLYKPAGILTHSVRDEPKDTGREETVADFVLKKYPEAVKVGDEPKTRPGIVHRLDRCTSGVLLIARTQEAFLYLKELFKERKINKTYLAIVSGKLEPKRGTIDAPISLKSGTVKRTVHKGKMSKEAVTDYKVLKYITRGKHDPDDCVSLVEVSPRTGRTHQIRVHLASIGHPIVGDNVYGGRRRVIKDRKEPNAEILSALARETSKCALMLHAMSLEFTGQSGKRIKIEAEPPEEFRNYAEDIL